MQAAGMRKRWRWKATDGPGAQRLAGALSVHPLVATLLLNRGVAEAGVAERFMKPRLTHLHDPALLPGVVDAGRRIARAVRQKQPIVIYGDYDVDGVTASSILWHTLRHFDAPVACYVPHRLEEGYGLNCAAVAELCDGCDFQCDDCRGPLIVTVDCGMTAIEPAQVAVERGVHMVITDHHEFDAANLPPAVARVHPRLSEEGRPAYPFGELCGAGVAFKLAWQVARELCGSDKLHAPMRDLLLDCLSLAALGTVADVVPLVDENRVIVAHGLGQIKRTRFAGLNALIDAARLGEETIDAYHVGFVLGPRLNACGRMGHAKDAVHLLTEAQGDEARRIAEFLTKENDRRRATERAIFDEARAMVLELGYASDDCRAIVLGKEGWHAGVVGIVASRLVEEFARPVVLLNVEDGQAHGSARSVAGVSIHEAIGACAQHLSSWGGHAMAAGLRLSLDRLDSFRQDLVRFVNGRLAADDLVSVLEIDADCPLEDATVEVFGHVRALEPFGRCNPTPVLCARGVVTDRPAQRIGKEGKHLRLMLRQDGRLVSAVAWNMGDLADDLPAGVSLDVAFEPKLSTWQGRTRAELHVCDLRVR